MNRDENPIEHSGGAGTGECRPGYTRRAWCRKLGRSSVEVFVEEERSADDETNHTSEAVGYLVTTPGELFGDGTGGITAGYGAGGHGAGAYGG